VVSDGRQLLTAWREAGDEAILLARRLPGVPVVVGGDRVRAGRLALQQFSPDTIVLDDGMQHRQIHRDVELVLVDATDPFGGERLLPRGRLREPLAGIRRAHAILVTRADQAAGLESLRRRLAGLGPGIPVGCAVYRPCRLLDLSTGREAPLDVLRKERVFAVSGIASPEGFHGTLRQLGAPVAGMLAFPDHHPFGPGDRARMSDGVREAGATCIVTTEKDAVRLEGMLPRDCPVLALGIELEVVEGAEMLDRLLGLPDGGAGRG
jgi:tetraacyldisaccharide 4'-kinase